MTETAEHLRQDSTGARSASTPVLTVIEPEAFAPLGRLGEWLFACGARLRVVRPWQGESIPDLSDVGDGLVLLGGAMSAHDDEAHPWIADLRHLVRRVVEERVPTVAICLSAQVAAEALGGATAVPSPHGSENGIVDIELTEAATRDPFLAPVIDAAVRAAVRTGVSTQDGTRLPVIVSHADGVVRLPEDAVLLATSEGAPIHAWRVGRLLALQHHPESTPDRIEHWQARSAAREMGLGLEGQTLETMDDAELPAEAIEAGRRARAEAERVDAVVQAFGRELARQLVASARAYAVTRR